MPGLLPATRPLAANYGQDLQNEKPVRNPELEADAANYNDVRHDAAFLGQVTSLARVSVSVTGSVATVARTYGVDDAYVTATWQATGKVRIEFDVGAHVNFLDASAACYSAAASTAKFASCEIVDALTVDVHSEDSGGDADCNFILSVF